MNLIPSNGFYQDPPTSNDDSRLSGADSDSEMLPVKQEMVELKDSQGNAYEGNSIINLFIKFLKYRTGASGTYSKIRY